MFKLHRSKLSTFIILSILIFVISLPGIESAAKAATSDNNWTAQPLFHARPATTLGPGPLTPTQIINAYSLTSASGAGTTIAIVDAYDDPTIASDLIAFSRNFGLPTANFVEHKMSSFISANSGWALEISLDVEWAHAIAPQATILLVEARSSSLTDLMSAVSYAKSQPGVVAVSMSWGGSEFSTETASTYDGIFTSTSGIVFFASSGDNGAGVIWPSISANVVSVGGTTLNLDQTNGVVTVISETAWSGSGGGVSAYEQQPAYQTNYGLTNTKRSTPDVSYDADPNTGVYVYDSTPYNGAKGWWDVGGTSAGAPQWAAIQALGQTTGNSNFYQDAKQSAVSYFRDITSGSNGNPAGVGYDLATGLGSPITTNFAPQTGPDFSISSSPNPVVINTGVTGNVGTATITVTDLSGYTGTVTLLAVQNALGLSLDPATSILTITVPSGTAARSILVTITGTDGTKTHTITLTVQVINPDYSISASPTSLTINSGSSGISTVTVSPLNGYFGTVQLSYAVTGGLTATFNPTSISSAGTSTVTVTVPSVIAIGTYTVTLTGTDGTNIQHSTPITVQVTNPDFTLSASPTSLTIRSGSTGKATITVNPTNGFTGTVALSSDKPSGWTTPTFTPTSITTKGTSTITITVPSNLRSGTYTFTITGTSSTLTHTAKVTVTVSR